MYKPPFTITDRTEKQISEISELAGELSETSRLNKDSALRRKNRIKAVYSSLAIEKNSLTYDQAESVFSGKPVKAPEKDVTEIRNAYEAYELMDKLDPYSSEDLLEAHYVMLRGLASDAGSFREGNVGVVDSSTGENNTFRNYSEICSGRNIRIALLN